MSYEITEDEVEVYESTAEQLARKLERYRVENRKKRLYFEGKNKVKDLGIATPPKLRNLNVNLGWARMACTVLSERITFDGWLTDEYELNSVYSANNLSVESGITHTEALKYGISFVAVTEGDTEVGEPEILVTVESPMTTTTHYDRRLRKVTYALMLEEPTKRGERVEGMLITENLYVPVVRQDGVTKIDARLEITEHGYGRVPVVPVINNRDGFSGHSEITETVISLVDQAQRTLLGMEINREYYSNPQKYMLGVDPEQFATPDGRTISPMSVMADSAFALPANMDNQIPTVGQFEVGSPTPFVDVLRTISQLFAAETSIPISRLWDSGANPTSADAIRQAESGLIKRAEDRIRSFSHAWEEVAKLILIIRDGEVPDGANLTPRFREPDSAARSANAQEVMTLVQTGILQPDSLVVFDRIGLSRGEQEIVKAENSRARATMLLNSFVNKVNPEEEVVSEEGE